MTRLSDVSYAPTPGPHDARPGSALHACLLLAGLLAVAGCGGGGHAGAEAAGGGIVLSPNPANMGSRITVQFTDDRMREADCRYEWRRNGSVIENATTNGLDPASFAKNDDITVTVSASGAAVGATRTMTGHVHVQNSPPRLTNVTIGLSTSSGAAQLEAHVQCADPDGDVPTYTYRWLRNGAPIENATAATLPLAQLGRGDGVVLEVTANDGEATSPPLRSEPYLSQNRPPAFTSQPMKPGSRDGEFSYQATAADPDGDELRFELVSGPAQMTVDATTGSVRWTLPQGDQRRGQFPVRLRVTDSKGGEATQEFTIDLDPPPAKTS